MEAQLQRPPHGHHQYEEDSHNAGLHSGGVEVEHNHHYGEKKSVLKKVKDKAKKIKDTIKKHGHGHEHEHEYRHDHVSEEDDDDEEMVNDPEVHGAPIYDSAVITGTNLPMQTGLDLEKPNDVREDRYDPNVYTTLEEIGVTRPSASGKIDTEIKNPLHYPNVEHIGVARPFASDKMETELERQPVEARHEPEIKNPLQNPNEEDIGITRTFGTGNLETELGRRPFEAHHETGIKNQMQNPTGEDIEVTRPSGLDEMETELERPPVKTADHEPEIKNPLQQYPDVNIGSGLAKMETGLGMPHVEADETNLLDPLQNEPYAVEMEEAKVVEPSVKIGPLMGLDEDPHSPKNRPGEKIPPSNYQSKVADPTGEGGKEADVGPLASRLDNVHIHEKSESNPVPEQGLYTGSHDQFAPQPMPTQEEFNPDPNPLELSQNPESPKDFDATNPDSMPRDTITGKISSATHVIADKAVSAKNVVASKLGYGSQQTQQQETQEASSRRPVSETAADYGHKVAEKLTPLYEKVAGAGSAILSKVQGSGGAVEQEGGDTVVKRDDKGVSVKEYLAVKLRPGDEDKALSEVITEALQRKKEAVPRTGVEQRVIETEDMAADLGTGRENKSEREDEVVAGSDSSGGGGVVHRLKGAVSSWLGKGTESASSGGIEHREEEVGSQQRRQQESGN